MICFCFEVMKSLQAVESKQNCNPDWDHIVKLINNVTPDDINEFKTHQSSKLPFGVKGIIINNIDLTKYDHWIAGSAYHFISEMQLYISLVHNGYFPYTDPLADNLRKWVYRLHTDTCIVSFYIV